VRAVDADESDEPVLSGDADEFAAGMRAYAADGTAHLIAALHPSSAAAVERFADAVRIVRAVVPA
jgi:alkanesulfonate monooxygenase SsuD/methylene tetrahydromethanopterin reductase-like flavin-dependent oxidoreductase (luciferase family)